MSSPYSNYDVSRRVEELVEAFLSKYPTLLLTASAIARELQEFEPTEVRDVLILECQRGMLEPVTRWRCEECDAVHRRPAEIDNSTGSGYCYDDCRGERIFIEIAYYKGTDSLIQRLNERASENDHSKKASAAALDSVERLKTLSPTTMLDVFDPELRAALMEGSRANVDTAKNTLQTAESTTRTADDPTPQKSLRTANITGCLTAINIVVAVIIGLFVWWATEAKFYEKSVVPWMKDIGHHVLKVPSRSSAGEK